MWGCSMCTRHQCQHAPTAPEHACCSGNAKQNNALFRPCTHSPRRHAPVCCAAHAAWCIASPTIAAWATPPMRSITYVSAPTIKHDCAHAAGPVPHPKATPVIHPAAAPLSSVARGRIVLVRQQTCSQTCFNPPGSPVPSCFCRIRVTKHTAVLYTPLMMANVCCGGARCDGARCDGLYANDTT